MPSHLLDLPPELIICVLCHLNLSPILSLANAYPSIRPIIEDFVNSHYRSATQEAMVNDNPHCDLPVLDRLAILRSREDGWAKLRVDLTWSIPIPYPSTVRHLESGHFVVSELYGRGFYSCKLPSKPSEHTTWSHIKVENFRDVVLSIDEHDLAAVVTLPSATVWLYQPGRIELRLLQFSTGNPHPLARSPAVILGDFLPSSAISINIYGDYIGIVCGNDNAAPDSPFLDHVFIINWKTGMCITHITASCGSYFDLTFLSSEIIILPNARGLILDIWRVPEKSSAPPTRPLFRLNLPPPPVAAQQVWNPRIMLSRDLSRTPTNSNRPFHMSPACALIGIKIRASTLEPLIFVVVHHHALTALILGSSESVTGVNVAGQHNDLDVTVTHWDPTTLDSDVPITIPWTEWGPSITRCFSIEDDGRFMDYETITAGQRCLVGFPSDFTPSIVEDANSAFFILDFNPSAVKHALEGVSSYTACTGPSGTLDVLCRCVLDSQMPFAFQRVNFKLNILGWLFMDEDQIVQYVRPFMGIPPELEVFHLGAEVDL